MYLFKKKKKKPKTSNYKSPTLYSKPLGPAVFRIHNFLDFLEREYFVYIPQITLFLQQNICHTKGDTQ